MEQANNMADEEWELYGGTFLETEYKLMCQWMTKKVQDGLSPSDTYNSWKTEETEENERKDIDTTLPDEEDSKGADFWT